ncbi:MAG: DUF3160 domain-containing protein, partial [Candidatus Neomarinimicrobiota bacterium]
VWLQAIRDLNPAEPDGTLPLFMNTTAWHHEKLNTQLASWSQLRHDNLLYAKQSYTAMASCSFPHSYVEPYPAFYRTIANFAEKSGTFFYQVTEDARITGFFTRMSAIMDTLEVIAQKELDHQPFSDAEKGFLKTMLYSQFLGCAPAFSGWYTDLFYDAYEDPAGEDFVIADVHTQPTDEVGNIVGRVLHVSVGPVNLGVFLAPSPSSDFQPVAFVGPVMSYYQQVTENFDRLTDERWTEAVQNGQLPARPDWVNVYLADVQGEALAPGRELPGTVYTVMAGDEPGDLPLGFMLAQNYPNPFNPTTTLRYELPRAAFVTLTIYDLLGREVASLVNEWQPAGEHRLMFDADRLPSGVYVARLVMPGYSKSIKMVVVR